MKRKADFMLHDVGGEKLLVPLGSQVMDLNGLVILNDTAAWVWDLLGQERTLDELGDAVARRFAVPPERARADVASFMDEIAGMGMLEQ